MIYFFLITAGFLKAVKDRLDAPRNNYGQYFTSHIMPKEGAFWNKGTGRKFLGYYFDAWHLADTFYILCFCSAAMFYTEPLIDHDWSTAGGIIKAVIIEILALFTITQLSFNLFYYLLKRKK